MNTKLLTNMKIQFKLSTIALAILIAMFSLSCNKDENIDEIKTEKQGALSFLDIIDAKSLIIGQSQLNSTLKNGNQENTPQGLGLFKITEDGVYQEIPYYRIDTIYTETDGIITFELDTVELTSIIYPKAIFKATSDYIIACFVEPITINEYNYLVRKSDGAVFELPGNTPTYPDETWRYGSIFQNENGSNLIQIDKDDNIYYLGNWKVNKISTINPDNLTYQVLTSDIEPIMCFIIDDVGNLVYPIDGKYKIRLNSGSINYSEPNAFAYWLGLDNHFYYDYRDNTILSIGKVSFEGSNITYNNIGIITHEYMGGSKLSSGFFFKMKTLNKIVIISGNFEGSLNPVLVVNEVYNSENELKSFLLSDLGLTEIGIGISSENFYYLSGMFNNQPGLIKVNPSGFPHTAVDLLPKGEFDIYKMVVSTDDELIFNALRMSDGNMVIGQISAGGMVSILQEHGNEVFQLIQLQ